MWSSLNGNIAEDLHYSSNLDFSTNIADKTFLVYHASKKCMKKLQGTEIPKIELSLQPNTYNKPK